ncbi:hypothetical protein OIU77_009918 [Salix suchowensis]|uniref:DUF4220 domain-containing protein n=1 Tax=Salix suchowensis TaxID=1278906 RepID=A0ABQ9A6K8_9ROSI|nr:hypothetical protein OIU77_009918 [Salix suchowensis]
MIPAAVSSLIYIKARSNMELFSPELMRLWKEWELRVLVLLSLILQVVLIFSGNRRKFTSRARIRFLLWCAYLMADWVATVALGVLLNKLGEVTKGMGRHRALNGNTDLAAFWAPFLLLHLGGPDTITAYALEDNELWLRHFLGLAVQTGVATYIIFLGWRGSHLSILTLPMFFGRNYQIRGRGHGLFDQQAMSS